MRRNCSLEDISDGNLYTVHDLANLSCNGCKGSANCCHGMGNSIVLDPYDIYRLTTTLKVTFEQLLGSKIELNVVDGIILPNLGMAGDLESCSFLNEKGRCSIHGARPGICRIFPLGRYYEDNTFHYILQANECPNQSETKMKVGKWIDTKDVKENEQFIISWHYFLNDVEDILKNISDDNQVKHINMYILNQFYLKPFTLDCDFYTQFNHRLAECKGLLHLK